MLGFKRASQKYLCFLGVLLFFIFTSISPYSVSVATARLFFLDPAELDISTVNLMEEKMEEVELPTYSIFNIQSESSKFVFSVYIPLIPQNDPKFSHKPPSTHVITLS